MKQLLLILGILIVNWSYGQNQKIDTVISTAIYKSYFNYQYHQPIFVVYKLYKGGGDCNRAGFRFINDTKIKTATQADYAHNGYDQGHLANAEDFAYDCAKDELTFRFYNCTPQTANLNRGVWKKWETVTRNESQSDSLLVIIGGLYGKKTMGKGKVGIPIYCWRVTQSLSTKKITHVLWFTNTNNATCKEVTLDYIEKLLGYKLPLKK